MSTDRTVVLITFSLLLLEASLLHANLKPPAAKAHDAELAQRMHRGLPGAADATNRTAATPPVLLRYQRAVYQIAIQERGSHFIPRYVNTEI